MTNIVECVWWEIYCMQHAANQILVAVANARQRTQLHAHSFVEDSADAHASTNMIPLAITHPTHALTLSVRAQASISSSQALSPQRSAWSINSSWQNRDSDAAQLESCSNSSITASLPSLDLLKSISVLAFSWELLTMAVLRWPCSSPWWMRWSLSQNLRMFSGVLNTASLNHRSPSCWPGRKQTNGWYSL